MRSGTLTVGRESVGKSGGLCRNERQALVHSGLLYTGRCTGSLKEKAPAEASSPVYVVRYVDINELLPLCSDPSDRLVRNAPFGPAK
jgi:hypothetical protein